jgi:hypothetical protein
MYLLGLNRFGARECSLCVATSYLEQYYRLHAVFVLLYAIYNVYQITEDAICHP